MLERAVGPQAAAAMVLFGVTVDGARAGRDRPGVVVPPRRRAARRGAHARGPRPRAPTGLLDLVKATLRQAPWQPDFEAAIATEVSRQAWSLGQGWFKTPG